jgi:hypothetical protein
MEEMMKQMMEEMRGLRQEVRQSTAQTALAIQTASQAQEMAAETKSEVAALRSLVVTKAEFPAMVEKIIADLPKQCATSVPMSMPKAIGGKATGKGEQAFDKKSRTIYFGKFPEDTKAEIITDFIKKWTQAAEDQIEEVYAFGKFAERGAARFKHESQMWDFLKEHRGTLNFDVNGTTVYANPDSMHNPFPDKTKAVRKLVRLLIEQNGGDGAKVKKDIVTNYTKGKVWWKDSKFAEWDEKAGEMKLVGAGADYEAAFALLMGRE